MGGDFTVFGPQVYQRTTGQPVTVTQTFTVQNASLPYTLHVSNSGVTNAVISVNGRTVLASGDFDRAPGTLARPVPLRAGANQIVVELRGAPRTSLTLEILGADNVPPTITGTRTPPANANGWNNTNVVVSFSCSDAHSGIATCPAPVTVSTEGANQIVSGTAIDKAGNTATARVTLNIDKTPPILTATPSPAPNANGWNNGPVVVTFTAADALSGIAPGSLSAPVTLSRDGPDQSATGQATDLAGNVTRVIQIGINIDQANPTITVSLFPPEAITGYYNTPVTAHFTCADTGSGVDLCPPDRVIATDGLNQ